MRRSSLRWFGFGVPLACLACVLLGDYPTGGLAIFSYMLAQFGALGAPDAFNRCAAKQLSTKKVMGSLIGAVILSLIGPVALEIYLWSIGEFVPGDLFIVGTITLTTILRCFEELFASQNDRSSATITTMLTAIAMGSTMLTGSKNFVIFGAVAVVTLISGAIALGFSRREWPRINFAILKEIPSALGRLLVYPALCAGLLYLNQTGNHCTLRSEVCAGIAGLILLEVSKSTFRRRSEEAVGLKVGTALAMLTGTGGLFALGCFYWETCFPMCQALFLAAGAAVMILYAPFDWESIAAIVVLLAGSAAIAIGITPEYFSFPREIFVGPTVGFVLCLLMFRQWGQLVRQIRANHLRQDALNRGRS